MSYDLMVFNKESAPKNREDFLKWYQDQTEWTEGHSYDDPGNTSSELRNWFMEMIKTFPAMNGPLASADFDDPHVTDYSIGRDVIYAAFAWSLAEEAYKVMFEMAGKFNVGFFNASSDELNIYFPDGNNLLIPVDNPENLSAEQHNSGSKKDKPWWKIW